MFTENFIICVFSVELSSAPHKEAGADTWKLKCAKLGKVLVLVALLQERRHPADQPKGAQGYRGRYSGCTRSLPRLNLHHVSMALRKSITVSIRYTCHNK